MNGKFLKRIELNWIIYLSKKDPPRMQQTRPVLKLQRDTDYMQLNMSPEVIGSSPYRRKTKLPAHVMEFNVLEIEFLVEYNY